jgi:hypothetical protein
VENKNEKIIEQILTIVRMTKVLSPEYLNIDNNPGHIDYIFLVLDKYPPVA